MDKRKDSCYIGAHETISDEEKMADVEPWITFSWDLISTPQSGFELAT